MDRFLKLSLLACFTGLIALNLAGNPFVQSTAIADTSACEGTAPAPDCECCEHCGCWACPPEEDPEA